VSTLEQSLQKLGVEKLSKDDVQKMQWETLEGKIGKWIQYMSIAVSILLPNFLQYVEQCTKKSGYPDMTCLMPKIGGCVRSPHRDCLRYFDIQVKLLFAAERKLCDQIWYHLDPHREKCFADVTDSSVHMLLSFGEAIAKSKKSPEKLFVLLDMHETMHNLLPEVTVSFY
jgi:exocyst complex protein 7